MDRIEFRREAAITLACCGLLAACGGGGGSSGNASQPPPFVLPPLPAPPTGDPIVRLSGQTPFAANCNGAPQSGQFFLNAKVEPAAALNPANPSNLIALWQQDRWSNGGSQGVIAGASFDGGHSWSTAPLAHSICAGGSAANGGNYQRASNAWAAFAPDGTAYALTLSFSGDVLAAGSSSAQLVARSTDGGKTWSKPLALIADGSAFFDDKGSITADPVSAGYVYATWDRINNSSGPAMLVRSSDGGQTWEAARVLYDPGPGNQTISNVIVVLADGTVVDSFVEIDDFNGAMNAAIKLVRSGDHGQTWSAPVKVADDLSVGIRDPDTGAPLRTSSLIPAIAAGTGSNLYIAWQDARFSNGQRDGIALAHSADGGLSWSAPVQINGAPTVPAFSPTINVRSDGEIGLTYYDFRDNTPDKATLPTDYWLTRSSDGLNWTETQIARPFDIDLAPVTTLGLFLGDYQSLLSSGGEFIPVYAQTNDGSASDPTDIYALLLQSLVGHAVQSRPYAGTAAPTPELRSKAQDNVHRILQGRRPGSD